MRAVALAMFLAATACAHPAPAPTVVPAAAALRLPALSYPLLDGGTWDSAAGVGRITVIDVWASYCQPCRKAFPYLNRLAADPTIAVVGISVDEDDDAVTAFLAEIPARFPIARDRTMAIAEAPLGVRVLPTVLVVDAAGRIRLRLGEPSPADYAALPAVIAALRTP